MNKSETVTSALVIKAGSLRQRIRKGEISPGDAMEWIEMQKYRSPDMINWLRNRMRVSKS